MTNTEIIEYISYKKMFNLDFSPSLQIFEKFLTHIDNYFIEFSNTINGTNTYNCRLTVAFHALKNKETEKNLLNILSFLNQLENINNVKFDYALINYILKNFDISEINRIGVGVDFRLPMEYSRLKVWFVTNGFSKKIVPIIKTHGNFSEVMPLMNIDKNQNNLFGVELSFQGSTRFKIYAPISNRKFSALKNEPICIFNLVRNCEKIYFSWDKNLNTVLHFEPKNVDKFISLIDNTSETVGVVRKIYEIYKCCGYNLYCISCLKKELLLNNISKVNLYAWSY